MKCALLFHFKPIDEHPDRDKPSRKADLAMQAICQFVRVTNEPGVWDIFITKLAEVKMLNGSPFDHSIFVVFLV